jgi:hypothetical protein
MIVNAKPPARQASTLLAGAKNTANRYSAPDEL